MDDDEFSLAFLEEELRDFGYDVDVASEGNSALSVLHSNAGTDVIVLDKVMPQMDGITLAQRLKRDAALCDIPVIMLTGDTAADGIRQGLDIGVFYYLQKPVDGPLLKSVIEAALRDTKQKRILRAAMTEQKSGFDLVDTCRFNFRTPQDASSLAAVMARYFPEPERVLTGLWELLINAVEHGNLEIGFDRKSELIQAGTWQDEVERRLASNEFGSRKANALFTRRNGRLHAIITDEGKGFDWRKYVSVDPSRATVRNGRGIAQAISQSFDRVQFNQVGNQVVAYVAADNTLDW